MAALKQLFAFARRPAGLVRSYLSFIASFFRRRNTVVELISGADDLSTAENIVIFSHYDSGSRVGSYVRNYLDALRRAGFSIVFVTTSPRIDGDSLTWLQQQCAVVMRRRNVGMDFGSYKAGIALLTDRSRIERLLLANDSVYGPFRDLKPYLEDMNSKGADLWGITDSWEFQYHVQSFFLLFGRRAITSPAFQAFWDGVRLVQSKRFVIRKYEVGLTRAMLGAGLRCKVVCPSRNAADAYVRDVRQKNILTTKTLTDVERQFNADVFGLVLRGTPVNATHFFWEYLIREMSCPFIKRELLRKNPARIPSLQHWEKVIGEQSDYDTDLIVEDLERVLRNRAV
ncbi:MAG TPA: rhamnan synthesis F family protein [Actinomycetota bacterium]|jgi:lipopolysaccharide biosynthesis protein|nr:rhamnan synthesis F family protein [Actinomycetota bacterium]